MADHDRHDLPDDDPGVAPADMQQPPEQRVADAIEHHGAAADPRPDGIVAEVTDDHGVIVERGLDQRVPSWLDTAVQYTWRGLVLVLGLAGVIYAMTRLYLVTLPIILALILSTLCVPPARRLERRGVPRLIAATIVVVGGIGTLLGVIALMAPSFIAQVQQLQPTVITAIDQVLTWLEEGPIGYDRAQVEELYSSLLDSVEGAIGTIASSVGSIALAVVEGITALVLAIVLLFFFVKDGEQLVAWFVSRTPLHHRDTARAAGTRGWVALSGFVRGTAAVALIDAVGIGIGLAIVGVDLVLPLAVLVFFGGFVPVIGAFLTGLLAVAVALAQPDGGLTMALIVAAIVLAVQQIESNVLQPTIMRRAVALHPVVILGVLTAGAVLIGIVGAFLAVPVAAVIAAVGNELRLRHEAAKQGLVVGPQPLGGPGVDPTTVRVEFPPETSLRAARRRRGTTGAVAQDGEPDPAPAPADDTTARSPGPATPSAPAAPSAPATSAASALEPDAVQPAPSSPNPRRDPTAGGHPDR